MSEQILLPGFRGDVVLVDGLCYEFTGYTAQPPEDLQVTAKFNTCEECGPSSSGFSGEMSSMFSSAVDEVSSLAEMSSMFSSGEMSSMFSSAVDEVSSLAEMSSMFSSAVDEVSSLAVDGVSSLAVDGVSSLAVDGVSSLAEMSSMFSSAVDGVSSSAEEGWLYTVCPGVIPCNGCDPFIPATLTVTLSGLTSYHSPWNGANTVRWLDDPLYPCTWLRDPVEHPEQEGVPALSLSWSSALLKWVVMLANQDALGTAQISWHSQTTDPCDPSGSYGSHFDCEVPWTNPGCPEATTCDVSY